MRLASEIIKKDFWNEEIELILSMRELQLIYDMVMDSDYKKITETDYYKENKIPYNNDFIGLFIDNVEKILRENGGLTIDAI